MILLDALEAKTFDARGKGDLLLSSNLKLEQIGIHKVLLDKLAPVPGDTDVVYDIEILELSSKENSIPTTVFHQRSESTRVAEVIYDTCVGLLKGLKNEHIKETS